MKVAQSCLTLCDPRDSPWNSPGQKTGVGSHSLLQGIFPAQGSNPGHPHCRWILYQLSHMGSLTILKPEQDHLQEKSPFHPCFPRPQAAHAATPVRGGGRLSTRNVQFLAYSSLCVCFISLCQLGRWGMVRVKAAVVLQDQPVIRSNPGTSLVVQWLRLQVSTAKGEGLIPGWGN